MQHKRPKEAAIMRCTQQRDSKRPCAAHIASRAYQRVRFTLCANALLYFARSAVSSCLMSIARPICAFVPPRTIDVFSKDRRRTDLSSLSTSWQRACCVPTQYTLQKSVILQRCAEQTTKTTPKTTQKKKRMRQEIEKNVHIGFIEQMADTAVALPVRANALVADTGRADAAANGPLVQQLAATILRWCSLRMG